LRPSQREGPGLISGETRPQDRLRPCRSAPADVFRPPPASAGATSFSQTSPVPPQKGSVPPSTYLRTKMCYRHRHRHLALLPAGLPVFVRVHTGRFLPRAHLPHLVCGLERESVSGGCGTLRFLSRRLSHPWAGRGAGGALAGQAMVRMGSGNGREVAVGVAAGSVLRLGRHAGFVLSRQSR
jgi:hypothetical protein